MTVDSKELRLAFVIGHAIGTYRAGKDDFALLLHIGGLVDELNKSTDLLDLYNLDSISLEKAKKVILDAGFKINNEGFILDYDDVKIEKLERRRENRMGGEAS